MLASPVHPSGSCPWVRHTKATRCKYNNNIYMVEKDVLRGHSTGTAARTHSRPRRWAGICMGSCGQRRHCLPPPDIHYHTPFTTSNEQAVLPGDHATTQKVYSRSSIDLATSAATVRAPSKRLALRNGGHLHTPKPICRRGRLATPERGS